MQVQSLGREDPMVEKMATQSRKSHGQRGLEGYSPWCHKESDTTLSMHVQNFKPLKIHSLKII